MGQPVEPNSIGVTIDVDSSWTDDDAPSLCYEFEQSVAFLFLTAVTAFALLAFAAALALKRSKLSGMNILTASLLLATAIRYSTGHG